ncbi:hypothetical protein G7Y89_g6770 [Cudoniella acicularis]|uniref:Uncharacterized protein n=1 Tax=Cudoniella acicularis TaxID=354080 RepID=A0A8H4RN92_9HELO|nr:hypothetical protein G7Y89_g6770 [Cudoniella acicularis]
MEPAVLAILDMAPALRAGLDLVACGSTLGNLLRFVRGQDKLFRILVEAVHDTVFFIRRENSPTELIPNVRGYGHSFPEAYTSWDPAVKGSASHQRLIRYRFGGLALLVRFEGDGYFSEGPSALVSKPQSQLAQVPTLDALIEDFSTSSVTPGGPVLCSNVEIKHAGDVISQSLIFDLKTRSARKKDQDILDEELPRLWVAQIQKFILAYREDGVFNNIKVRDVREEVGSWERDHSNELSILAALIHRIIALVRSNPDGKLELRYAGLGNLKVREQSSEAGNTLSPEVKSLWMRKAYDNSNSTSGEDGGIAWVETSENDYTALFSVPKVLTRLLDGYPWYIFLARTFLAYTFLARTLLVCALLLRTYSSLRVLSSLILNSLLVIYSRRV